MKITNLLILVCLVCLFSACGGDANKTTTNEPTANTANDSNNGSATTSNISSAVAPDVVGYIYGMIVSKQFGSMNMSAEEKNIDKIVEGIQQGLSGDKSMVQGAVKELQARFGKPDAEASATPEAAAKVAYNLGISMMGAFQQLEMPASNIDISTIKEGYQATEAKTAKYNDQQLDSLFKAFIEPYQKVMQAKMQAEQESKAAGAIEAGRKFLAENAKKEGVVTLPSGLQYKVIKEGKGPKPTLKDEVKTHYHGTLIDGSIFDSSVDRGTPATFPVGGVIRGWQEGIPLMSVGAQYKFFIPQELAYGMQAPSPKIPAGSTLIFDVELFEINPGK